MFPKSQRTRWTDQSRRGAIAVLVAVLLPILLLLTGFAVNVAYMEMVQTELRISTDSAAKAALISYGATQSTSTAISKAQSVSGNNLVAGQTLALNSTNVLFGNATKNANGVYAFTSGGTPKNAVKVNSSVSVPIFFNTFLPGGNISMTQSALTTRVAYDIALVLDRSASMAFDLSANEFSYPADRQTYSTLQAYFTAPSATLSRWASLTSAVNTFVSVLQARNLDAHVALVTFSENYTLGTYSSVESTLDCQLSSNYAQINTAMNVYGQSPLLGDTNISAGLATAETELTGPRARVTANRVLILLSDGVSTTGNANLISICSGYRTTNNIMTYTIAFGGEAASGTPNTEMSGAAAAGNGVFYDAPSAATLQSAFQNIADSLPAVLIN